MLFLFVLSGNQLDETLSTRSPSAAALPPHGIGNCRSRANANGSRWDAATTALEFDLWSMSLDAWGRRNRRRVRYAYGGAYISIIININEDVNRIHIPTGGGGGGLL